MEIDREPTTEQRIEQSNNTESKQIKQLLIKLTELEAGYITRSTVHRDNLNYLSITFFNHGVTDRVLYDQIVDAVVETFGTNRDDFSVRDNDPERVPYFSYNVDVGLDSEIVEFIVESLEAYAQDQLTA